MEAHSVLPSTGLQAPAGSQPLLSRVPGTGLQGLGAKHCPELSAQGLLPLRGGCAREPKRTGEARTAHDDQVRQFIQYSQNPRTSHLIVYVFLICKETKIWLLIIK